MTGSSPNQNQKTNNESDDAVDKNKEFNVFRDTPVRYLGYCNEVGESFRYQFPRFVTPSYIISFGYCCADAGQAGWRVWSSSSTDEPTRQSESLRAMVDTVVWQSTASVLVPGFTINCLVKASRWIVRRPPVQAALPAVVFQWFPTAMGLGSIPFIVHPIDHMTDILLDETLRKIWKPAAIHSAPTTISTTSETSGQ